MVYCVCLGFLPAYVSVHHLCLVPTEARQRCVLGIKLRSADQVLLPACWSITFAHCALLELLQHGMKSQSLQWSTWLSEGPRKIVVRRKETGEKLEVRWYPREVGLYHHVTKHFQPPTAVATLHFIAVTSSSVTRKAKSGDMAFTWKSSSQWVWRMGEQRQWQLGSREQLSYLAQLWRDLLDLHLF